MIPDLANSEYEGSDSKPLSNRLQRMARSDLMQSYIGAFLGGTEAVSCGNHLITQQLLHSWQASSRQSQHTDLVHLLPLTKRAQHVATAMGLQRVCQAAPAAV